MHVRHTNRPHSKMLHVREPANPCWLGCAGAACRTVPPIARTLAKVCRERVTAATTRDGDWCLNHTVRTLYQHSTQTVNVPLPPQQNKRPMHDMLLLLSLWLHKPICHLLHTTFLTRPRELPGRTSHFHTNTQHRCHSHAA